MQSSKCKRADAKRSLRHFDFCILHLELALTLFVLGVGADHAHDVLAADDLAVFTDTADAAADFHGSPL
jgi:hypothetical protein